MNVNISIDRDDEHCGDCPFLDTFRNCKICNLFKETLFTDNITIDPCIQCDKAYNTIRE